VAGFASYRFSKLAALTVGHAGFLFPIWPDVYPTATLSTALAAFDLGLEPRDLDETGCNGFFGDSREPLRLSGNSAARDQLAPNPAPRGRARAGAGNCPADSELKRALKEW
jgi:hypothetical protein